MSPQVELTEEEAFFVEARRERLATTEVECAARERTRNREAKVRARRRDGDQCRVCHRDVDFQDRRSRAGGRYLPRFGCLLVVCAEHYEQFKPKTLEELDPSFVEAMDDPQRVVYRAETRQWLAMNAAADWLPQLNVPGKVWAYRCLDSVGYVGRRAGALLARTLLRPCAEGAERAADEGRASAREHRRREQARLDEFAAPPTGD